MLALHEASMRQQHSSEPAAWRLVIAGGYDARLAENREYFEELSSQVQQLGLSDQVRTGSMLRALPSCMLGMQ